MKSPKIYYAHSKIIYGTAREQEEILFLKQKYPAAVIINPANNISRKTMPQFLKLVGDCNLLVVSEFDGFVGKGAFSEITRALSDDKTVYAMRRQGKKYNLIIVSGVMIIKSHDWKKEYAKLILNN